NGSRSMRRAITTIALLLACIGPPVEAQTMAQADTLRAGIVNCIGWTKGSTTQIGKADSARIAQDTTALRRELNRASGQSKAATTVCTNMLAYLDRLLGRTPPIGEPVPDPPPPDTIPAELEPP